MTSRWVFLPLVTGLIFTGSGFLDAFERTTVNSAALADASADAPRTTGQAAEDVASLPEIAEVTAGQADAFDALADALESSAGRVDDLNDTVAGQLEELGALAGDIDAIRPAVSCARTRLADLVEVSRAGPGAIARITAAMERIGESQERSIEHLESINRKLLVLGLAGTAAGVEPPPPPGEGTAPSAEGSVNGAPCP